MWTAASTSTTHTPSILERLPPQPEPCTPPQRPPPEPEAVAPARVRADPEQPAEPEAVARARARADPEPPMEAGARVRVRAELGDYKGFLQLEAQGRDGRVKVTQLKSGRGWSESPLRSEIEVLKPETRRQREGRRNVRGRAPARAGESPPKRVCVPMTGCSSLRTHFAANPHRESPPMRARPLVAADPTRWPADLRIETVFAEAETHRRAQPIRFFSASEIRHELARLTGRAGAPSVADATARFEAEAAADVASQLQTAAPHEVMERMMRRLTAMIEQEPYEPQLVKMRLDDEELLRMSAALPTTLEEMFSLGDLLEADVEPTLDEFHVYRKHLTNGQYDRRRTKSFRAMVADEALVIGRTREYGSVTLNTRVRRDSELHRDCSRLGADLSMAQVCAASEWSFGAAMAAGEFDDRWYAILGWNGGLTPSHTDAPGVQAVLYHTAAGTNTFLGVPRRVAVLLQAVREALEPTRSVSSASLAGFEAEVLRRCLCAGKLQHGAFARGETAMILPRGGHAVLTGDFKVVVAGEWHLRATGTSQSGS